MYDNLLNVKDFDAKGNGKTDDTKAIQTAIDKAAEVGGGVFMPPGTYLSGEIQMRAHGSLTGVAGFSYRNPGGTIIRLNDPKARCLVNITGAFGCTVQGLCLMGEKLGDGVHGMFLDKPDYGKEEDAFRIDTCLVSHFTGHGVNLQRVWCFSLRHSMIAYNKGDGLRVKGWDAFIMDNWFSGNVGAGYGAYEENASITMTGNRIEWNQAGGIVMRGGNHYNITGNYIDRCGGAGILMSSVGESGAPAARVTNVTITGNVIYRSGKWPGPGPEGSCHLYLEGGRGVAVVGNTVDVGRDDDGSGRFSPSAGIVYKGMSSSVITNNVMDEAAMDALFVDLGGNAETAIVKDNPGCLCRASVAPSVSSSEARLP